MISFPSFHYSIVIFLTFHSDFTMVLVPRNSSIFFLIGTITPVLASTNQVDRAKSKVSECQQGEGLYPSHSPLKAAIVYLGNEKSFGVNQGDLRSHCCSVYGPLKNF